jgi:hypothetical protein
MSGAAMAVQAALVAALRDHAPFAEVVTGIYDGAPPRAAWPYAVIGDGTARDWSHVTASGREHRIGITIWDEGNDATRLLTLMGEAETAIEAMNRNLGGHWLVSLAFLRSAVARDVAGPWGGLVQYRARTLAD